MRNKKHNTKVQIIAGVVIFVIISVIVLTAKDMQTISRVKVSSQEIVINQGDTGISNANVGLNNAGNLNNQNVNGSNANVDIGNNGQFNNSGGSFSNNGNFQNQGANFGNQGEFGNAGGNVGNNGEFHNAGGEFGNAGGRFGNSGSNYGNEGEYGNYNVGFGNQDYRSEAERYKYQNIDWSTWRSNFVNRILDDSMYIESLDYYGLGTWFYYSFIVTDDGSIKDVTVFSFYLKDEDKKQIRNLIRSYAHQPITKFPMDSRRKKAKVKAVMLLGDTESKSNASNFRDIEKIKIKY